MAAKQSRKTTSEPQYEDFEPVPDLQESPEKYILLVNLPGFKKEDFRVQLDGLGNLTVKGQKPVGDNKFKRLNVVFLLPHDSDLEKIRGKFEGETLIITLPRREKVVEKLKEEENEPQKEEAIKSEQKKEDQTKEEGKDSEKKEQVEPKEERKEPINSHEGKEELKESKPKEEKKSSMYEKFKDKISDKVIKKSEEKNMISWREKISQELEDLSNKVSIDNLLETLNKNKKEIAVGVAAFSIGFLISRKLSCNK